MRKVLETLLTVFALSQVAAPLLVVAPLSIYYLCTGQSWAWESLLSQLLLPIQILAQLLLLAYVWMTHRSDVERGWNRFPDFGYVKCAVWATLSAAFCLSLLAEWLSFLPDWTTASFEAFLHHELGIFSLVLLGPIAEEWVFRGAIQGDLARRYTPSEGIVWSAVWFAVYHLNPMQMIPAFVIGLLLAWVRHHTRSLWLPILLHILNNSLSVGFARCYPTVTSLSEWVGHRYLFPAFFGGLLVSLLCLWGMHRTHHPRTLR